MQRYFRRLPDGTLEQGSHELEHAAVTRLTKPCVACKTPTPHRLIVCKDSARGPVMDYAKICCSVECSQKL